MNQEIKFLEDAIRVHELMVQKLKKRSKQRGSLISYYEQSILDKKERIEEIEKGG